MMTVYSPLTWGMYNEPPPDIPECGFVGELCPPSTRSKSSLKLAVTRKPPGYVFIYVSLA